ncbi:MAG TPA: hypothetical protein ENJ09_13095 [Planctomycetes bacterium]|nr:hypothetical protein [Planctomycetota bacterium]
MASAAPAPNCLACSKYFVTYEPSHPHGCRAFSIRSRLLPSLVVEQSSGAPCQAFAPRPRPAGDGGAAR